MRISESDLDRIRDIVRAVVREELARQNVSVPTQGDYAGSESGELDGEWVDVDSVRDYCESCRHMRKHHRDRGCNVRRRDWSCVCRKFAGPAGGPRQEFRPSLSPEENAEIAAKVRDVLHRLKKT